MSTRNTEDKINYKQEIIKLEKQSAEQNQWIPLPHISYISVYDKWYRCTKHEDKNNMNRGHCNEHLKHIHGINIYTGGQIQIKRNIPSFPPKLETKTIEIQTDLKNSIQDYPDEAYQDEIENIATEKPLSERLSDMLVTHSIKPPKFKSPASKTRERVLREFEDMIEHIELGKVIRNQFNAGLIPLEIANEALRKLGLKVIVVEKKNKSFEFFKDVAMIKLATASSSEEINNIANLYLLGKMWYEQN